MSGRHVAFVGDVHLERDDPELGAFLRMLERVAGSARTIVFLGDLFNLWVARDEFEGAHHRAVLGAFDGLRRAGVEVSYVEGNRDYRVARRYGGTLIGRAAEGALTLEHAGRRIVAVHGDLANSRDRQYRTWRRISRSPWFWRLFLCVPVGRRAALADRLESRMRSSNLAYKGEFPETEVRSYAERFFREGADLVVLGHFHVERVLAAVPPSPRGTAIVLPEWKGSKRHLRVGPDGEAEFVDDRES